MRGVVSSHSRTPPSMAIWLLIWTVGLATWGCSDEASVGMADCGHLDVEGPRRVCVHQQAAWEVATVPPREATLSFMVSPRAAGAEQPRLTSTGLGESRLAWSPVSEDVRPLQSAAFEISILAEDEVGCRLEAVFPVEVEAQGRLRFGLPRGRDLTLDLSEEGNQCLSLQVDVIVEGCGVSGIGLAASSLPEGATFVLYADGRRGVLEWCPTQAQLDVSLSYSFTFHASANEGLITATKEFSVVFVR